MAGKRIETMDLRQLIILKKQGFSNRKIAHLLQISRNTVNGYIQIFEGSGQNSVDKLLKKLVAARLLTKPDYGLYAKAQE